MIMAQEQDTRETPGHKLILVAPCTEMKKVIKKVEELAGREPEILGRLAKDRDDYAKTDKMFRELGKEHDCAARVDDLPDFGCEPSFGPVHLQETGRPRLVTPLMMFVFLALRGWFGSVSDSDAVERLMDSSTLEEWLHSRKLRMPGRSTIHGVLNMISNTTREFILDCQISMVSSLKLDDFSKMSIDSTSVAASTCWPTDSAMIVALLSQAFGIFGKLPEVGIDSFKVHWCKTWLKKLDGLNSTINMIAGKPNSRNNVKKNYKEMLRVGQKMLEHLIEQKESLESDIHSLCRELPPSHSFRFKKAWNKLDETLAAVARVLHYTGDRVFNGVVLPSSEKVLSISDKAAAYIKKGDREPVIGYKPQLARSGNGFITSLILEQGNPADVRMFKEVVDNVIVRTGTTPQVLSVDDGYSSTQNYKYAKDELKIEVVSFNGSKGRKFTPEQDWESDDYLNARNWRSSVESLMYVVKYSYDMKRMRRRGLSEVRAEMLEKVIAYNFFRMCLIEERLSADKAA
jgi:hypothetical protein